MYELQTDLNKFSPQLLVKFEKLKGTADKMQKDDEFQIHIAGLWNGPVRDAIVDFIYDKVPIAKLAQTEMWTLFCQAFSKRLVSAKPNEVVIITERQDEETGQWKKL